MSNDTTTAHDYASTLGQAMNVLAIDAGAAFDTLEQARAALDAGDMDKVALLIRNATAPSSPPRYSVQALIYECLPRDDSDGPNGGMG